MEFSGPQPADLVDVESLNRAFLACLRSKQAGASLRQKLPVAHHAALRRLTDLQIDRLAGAPFLLFSLREEDTAYWKQIFANEPGGDLFATPPAVDDPGARIVTAALGYIWQLARSNPYSTRLVCGASIHWCEQLAASPLVTLLQRCAERSDLLEPRLAADSRFWNRLLGPGLSPQDDVRRAAKLCALQTLLTGSATAAYTPARAAACRTATPARQLAAGRE